MKMEGVRGMGLRVWRGCSAVVLLAGALASVSGAAWGQQAYFSFEGDFPTTGGDQHDFTFNLAGDQAATSGMFFRTYAGDGGANLAGDTIADGPIDPILNLFTGGGAFVTSDDDSFGLDSQIDFTISTDSGPLPDPLTAGDYRLNHNTFGNDDAGPWALDLAGPAGNLTLTGASPVNSSTVTSLKFGTIDTGMGTDAATFNQAGTLDLAGDLVVAQTGNAVLTHDGAATTTVAGSATVNAGGTLNVTGNGFRANGGLTVDGGALNFTPVASLQAFVGTGQTFTASNNAQVTISSTDAQFFTAFAGNTYQLLSGADVTAGGAFNVGNSSTGTVVVDGPGSTFTTGTASIGSNLDWGLFGGSADVTFRNGAVGDLRNGFISLASGSGTPTADVSVESGATLTLNNLTLADDVAGTATLTVTGANSAVTQNPTHAFRPSGTELVVGGDTGTGGPATINLADNGTFTTGLGTTTLNDTGTINLDDGTFVLRGDLDFAGGLFEMGTDGTLDVRGGHFVAPALGGQPAGFVIDSFLAGGSYRVTDNGTLDLSTINLGIGSPFFGAVEITSGGAFSLSTGSLAADRLILDGGTLDLGASPGTLLGLDVQLAVNDFAGFSGSHTYAGLVLGYTQLGGRTAALTLDNGDALTLTQELTVGFDKAATLTVDDATLDAQAGIYVGFALSDSAANDGSLVIRGSSTVTAGQIDDSFSPFNGTAIFVGFNNNSSLTLENGGLEADGLVVVNLGSTFTMSGGLLEADGLANLDGTLAISNGSLRLNTLINSDSDGVGTLDLGNANLNLGIDLGSDPFNLGAVVNVGAGESLSASYVDVGDRGVDATLNITGGGVVNNTGAFSDIGDASTAGSAGTVLIEGVGSTWNSFDGVDLNRGTVTIRDGGRLNALNPNAIVLIREEGKLVGSSGRIVVDTQVENRGTLAITASTFIIEGDYVQTPDGRLEISGDPANSSFPLSELRPDGDVTLAGEIAFVSDDPLADFAGLTAYTRIDDIIFNFDATAAANDPGIFDTVTGHILGDGTALAVLYGVGAVREQVSVQRVLFGDGDRDGFISQPDLDLVLLNWGDSNLDGNDDDVSWATGDFNGDGFIGQADLDAVLLNWGDGTPPNLSAIPEPSTLIFCGLLGLVGSKRSGRRTSQAMG